MIHRIGRLRSVSLIFLITSVIKNRIGRHDVLLPIYQNYDKIRERTLTTRQQFYVFIKKKNKNLGEIRDNSVRIHLHAGMTCQLCYYIVQLQA